MPWFQYTLKSEPASAEDIIVTIKHDRVIRGRRHKGYELIYKFEDFTYNLAADTPIIRLNFQKLRENLEKYSVKPNMNVHIDIAYVRK